MFSKYKTYILKKKVFLHILTKKNAHASQRGHFAKSNKTNLNKKLIFKHKTLLQQKN